MFDVFASTFVIVISQNYPLLCKCHFSTIIYWSVKQNTQIRFRAKSKGWSRKCQLWNYV